MPAATHIRQRLLENENDLTLECQVICITNKLKNIIHTYNIHGINLQKIDSVKYLGVTIDSNLNWKEHGTSVYNKATFMMYFYILQCAENLRVKFLGI